MDIHLVSTDKKTFLVVTLSVKSGEGGVEELKRIFSLGPLNMICQVRSQGGWSGFGMAKFQILESNLE